MDRDYSNMTEKQALEILNNEWLDYSKETEQMIKDGRNLVNWLSILESFA